MSGQAKSGIRTPRTRTKQQLHHHEAQLPQKQGRQPEAMVGATRASSRGRSSSVGSAGSRRRSVSHKRSASPASRSPMFEKSLRYETSLFCGDGECKKSKISLMLKIQKALSNLLKIEAKLIGDRQTALSLDGEMMTLSRSDVTATRKALNHALATVLSAKKKRKPSDDSVTKRENLISEWSNSVGSGFAVPAEFGAFLRSVDAITPVVVLPSLTAILEAGEDQNASYRNAVRFIRERSVCTREVLQTLISVCLKRCSVVNKYYKLEGGLEKAFNSKLHGEADYDAKVKDRLKTYGAEAPKYLKSYATNRNKTILDVLRSIEGKRSSSKEQTFKLAEGSDHVSVNAGMVLMNLCSLPIGVLPGKEQLNRGAAIYCAVRYRLEAGWVESPCALPSRIRDRC